MKSGLLLLLSPLTSSWENSSCADDDDRPATCKLFFLPCKRPDRLLPLALRLRPPPKISSKDFAVNNFLSFTRGKFQHCFVVIEFCRFRFSEFMYSSSQSFRSSERRYCSSSPASSSCSCSCCWLQLFVNWWLWWRWRLLLPLLVESKPPGLLELGRSASEAFC